VFYSFGFFKGQVLTPINVYNPQKPRAPVRIEITAGINSHHEI
jgi:hypothetical protein